MTWFRDDDAFERAIADLRQRLRAAFPPSKERRDEWLHALYEERSERFRSDNQMVWTTGGIIVPIAFAAFAIPMQAKVTSGWSLLLLAGASTLLLLFWVLVHENLRAFQNKSMATLIAIEREFIGFEDLRSAKVGDFKPPLDRITRMRAVQSLIWRLLFALVLGWVLTVWSRWSTLSW